MIEIERATELARDQLQRRFTGRIADVFLLEQIPGPVYKIREFVADDWLVFGACDPDVHRVGGSECVAVQRETGEVLSLGMLGE